VVDHITNLLWLISLCGVRLIYRDQTEKMIFFRHISATFLPVICFIC